MAQRTNCIHMSEEKERVNHKKLQRRPKLRKQFNLQLHHLSSRDDEQARGQKNVELTPKIQLRVEFPQVASWQQVLPSCQAGLQTTPNHVPKVFIDFAEDRAPAKQKPMHKCNFEITFKPRLWTKPISDCSYVALEVMLHHVQT